MDSLSRQEYPAMLASLQPAQAVSTLNERVKRISKVNVEISDWLLERRKVEEAYVQGLKKLSHKQPPDSQSELGIFTTPWQKIVAATETIAQSHHTFATRIEQDVEQPLRNFVSKNREVQAMGTMQGNLISMAKELDEAQQRVEKLGKKGGKASSVKVDSATQKLDQATSAWDSQAPFVFEKLQAVDETRLNHLRDVLTQYQTHETDQIERSRVNAENTLDALLEVETGQEIQNFARNTTKGKPKIERNVRRTSSSAGSNNLPPPPPAIRTGDDTSQHSGRNEASSEPKGEIKESKSGLKRLGTMLGRRRQSIHGSGSFIRATSPTKGGYSPFGRAPGSREGRPIPSPRASTNNLRDTPSRDNRLSSLAELPPSPLQSRNTSQLDRQQSQEAPNGEFTGFKPGSLLNPESAAAPKPYSHKIVNGAPSNVPDLSDVQPPPGPPPSHLKEDVLPSMERDSEGFTVRAVTDDPISLAQQEAGNEVDQPQFKLDIKNEPIREEGADAQAALSNVANVLRSSTLVPSRKMGTVRGRRDVRNTMFIPAPESSGTKTLENNINIPPSPGVSPSLSHGAHRAAALATLSTEQSAASDTQSIRSARSLGSSTVIKHPEMHSIGLNSSIVETVSVFFENGEVKAAAVIGEVAFAYYGQTDSSSPMPESETIRLDNFPALEAIAPNHAFVSEHEARGEYTLNLSHLSKTTVAFRYKVHISDSDLIAHAPVLLKPSWRPQGDKLGVVIDYSLNPAFATNSGSTITTLSNFVLIATYEGAKAASCQTKPTGTHLKDNSLIYWRLGDVALVPENSAQRVVGRLVGSDGAELKPGIIEARWEISGTPGQLLGSGLGVSRFEVTGKGKDAEGGASAADPFADGDLIANQVAALLAGGAGPLVPRETRDQEGKWVEVESQRRLMSGKYDARQVLDDSAVVAAAAVPVP